MTIRKRLTPKRARPWLERLEERAVPATFTVTNNVDNTDTGSLRWAVGQANTTAGPDTIDFAEGLSGQAIILSNGRLDLTETGSGNRTTITGPAGGFTINANGASGVIQVATNAEATLNNLTITGGSFSYGGGIANNGSLTITNSTISGNTSVYDGGALLVRFGSATVTNTTITNNTSSHPSFGGGGIGVRTGRTLSMTNSLVAGNLRNGTPDDIRGTSVATFSLIGTTAGWTPGTGSSDNVTDTDAMLDTLADNGGPTKTHALLAGSPAIDAGTGSDPDQRGVAPVGVKDIGAFEFAPPPTPETEVTLVNGNLTITDVNGGTSNDYLKISYDSGFYTVTDINGLILTTAINGATGDNTSTLVIPDTGVTGVRLDVLGGDDLVVIQSLQATLPGGLSVTGGAGVDKVDVRPALNTGAGNIDIAADEIVLATTDNGDGITPADLTTTSGNVTLTADSKIVLEAGASITTVGGSVTLIGNDAAMPFGSATKGIQINSAQIVTTSGDITLTGAGASPGGVLVGVQIYAASVIQSDSGSIAITGTGGNGSSFYNLGITIRDTTTISTVSGDIDLVGTGAGTGTFEMGIEFYGEGSGTTVTSQSGDIRITGTGSPGGSGGANSGISFSAGVAKIESTGTGTITLTGTARIGSSGIASAGGTTVTIGGASASGDIKIVTDTLGVDAATTLSIQSTGALTLRPNSPGTSIGVGGGVADLVLTDAFLAGLADGFTSITIGDAEEGVGYVAVDTATFRDPVTIVGGTKSDGSGKDITLSPGDVVTFAAPEGRTVAPGGVDAAGTLVVAGAAAIADAESVALEFGGAAPGSFDQISATGAVTIGMDVPLTLLATGGFVPSKGSSFTIISRTGGSGTFKDLPEGATLANFLGSGLDATITYAGGDGDDVVIAVEAALPVVSVSAGARVLESVTQPGDFPSFRFERTGDATAALTVSVTRTGAASDTDFTVVSVAGGSYNAQAGTVTFDAGASFVDITVAPVQDGNAAEGEETIIFTVVDGADYDPDASSPAGTVTIAANGFSVINTSDSGEGSLRQAVLNASAIAGANTITFNGMTFTDTTPDVIVLTGGPLTLTETLEANKTTITGPGAGLLTISANNASRIFDVAASVFVELTGLTLTGGNSNGSGAQGTGGAIRNAGTLTIGYSVLTGNTSNNANNNGGGAISNSGTLTVDATTFSNNVAPSGGFGGAIYHLDGKMTILRSTFSNNSADSLGGAVYSAGEAMIVNSTFSGNASESDFGGAICADSPGPITILNSTIVGNRSSRTRNSKGGGGVFSYAGDALTLQNTIVVGNFRGMPGQDVPDDILGFNGATVNSASSNNLIGPGGSGGLTATNGNILLASAADAKLGPLADNGGPTRTHGLLAGSPAIDAGTGSELDQRGVAASGPRDIGAYELSVASYSNEQTNQALTDKQTLAPFATLSISQNETFTVHVAIVDGVRLGDFTPASVVGWQRVLNIGNIRYARTFTGSTAGADAQAAVRALVFDPKENLVPVGQATTTSFVVRSYHAGGVVKFAGAISARVTSANDAPTDITLSASTARENATAGTLVGLVSGTDPDVNPGLRFALINNAGGRFRLIGNRIEVAQQTPLDYEQGASHVIRVRVTDASGASFEKDITITVVNETITAQRKQYRSATAGATFSVNAANGLLNGATSTGGRALQAQVVTSPNVGRLTLRTDGSFSLVPPSRFRGTIVFSFRIWDGKEFSANQTCSIVYG